MHMICNYYNKYRDISIGFNKFWFIRSICTCLRSLISLTQYSIILAIRDVHVLVYTLVTL